MLKEKARLPKFILSLNTLTFSSTQVFLFTLFPVLAEKLSLPLSSVVGSFTVGTFLFLWGAPFWTKKSGSMGCGNVLSLNLLGLSVSFGVVALLLSSSFELSQTVLLTALILGRIIYGVTASGIVPVSQLARTDLSQEKNKFSPILSHSLSLNLGRALGPTLLIFFQGQLETLLTGLFLWTLILCLMNKLIAPAFPLKIHRNREKTHLSTFLFPLLVSVFLAAYTGILHSSLGGILQRAFSLSGIEASLLMAKVLTLASILMILVQLAGKLFLTHQRKFLLRTGVLSLFSGALNLVMMEQMIDLWIAISFIALGLALLTPTHLALIYEVYPAPAIPGIVGALSSGNTLGHALGGAIASLFLGPEVHLFSLVAIILIYVCTYVSVQKVSV